MSRSAAGPILLDETHAAFIRTGVSIVAASSGAGNLPRMSRAIGCRISADRACVTLLFPREPAAPLLEAVRASGRIAAVFSEPPTHRTIQLKGRDARIAPGEPGDAALMARYADAFCASLKALGYVETIIRTVLAHDPADTVAVAFTPSAAFDQTPGPRAGARLAAA